MHAHALIDQLVGVLAHGAIDQAEQAGDLFVGPAPVLLAEDVQRQDLDAAVGRDLDDGPDGLDPLDVAGDARQPAGSCPAAVAVHDDRDVSRALAQGAPQTSITSASLRSARASMRLHVPIGQALQVLELAALLVLGQIAVAQAPASGDQPPRGDGCGSPRAPPRLAAAPA